MTSNISSETQLHKQKQWRIFGVCCLGGVLFVIVILGLMSSQEHKKAELTKKENMVLATPLNHVDATSAIMQQAENRYLALQKDNHAVQQQLQALQETKNGEKTRVEKQAVDIQHVIDKIATLEKQLSQLSQTPQPTPSLEQKGYLVAPYQRSNDSSSQLTPSTLNNTIRVDEVSSTSVKDRLLPEKITTTLIKNPDNYVPSGTFAQAVMIGGADASASVNSQANPTPMLFRITDEGTLPNRRRSHLKDCFVTAAVVGDISSERGQIRLETMSCTTPANIIIDIPVQGTVFGSEGKNGVRGIPLWREGAVLQRAFAAGALSGLADGLSQQFTTNSISPLGNTQTLNTSGVFQYGAAQGTSHAMTKLADYNIRRAEQYHPVIQISAGTVVDIVFLKGFYLDGKKHDDSLDMLQTTRDEVTDDSKNNTESENKKEKLPTLPLTEQQINRLKAHDAELGFSVTDTSTS